MQDELVLDRWYWTRARDDDEWWPMRHNPNAAGGWSNWDTDEDFQHEIVEWVLIPLPDELATVSEKMESEYFRGFKAGALNEWRKANMK